MTPKNTQRVQDDRVFPRHFLGIDNDFVGVVDRRIHRQAPALMSEDTVTLLTSRLCVVSVAVIRDWVILGHGFLVILGAQIVWLMQRSRALPNPTALTPYRATQSGRAQK